MKKRLIAICAMACAFAAQASQVDVAEKNPRILFEAGKTTTVSSVIDGQVVPREFFDGMRIVRLADGNCQVESHRYQPNPADPISGETDISKAVFGYNCILSQWPAELQYGPH